MDKKYRRDLLSSAGSEGSRPPTYPQSGDAGAYPPRVNPSSAIPARPAAPGPLGRAHEPQNIPRQPDATPEEAGMDWVPAPTRPAAEDTAEGTRSRTKIALAVAAGVFLLAALPRLYFVFFVTDPPNPGIGWYGDTFHHWQIAYLTKEVGFSQGFLTLWDFKGMEYFWGPLHPLLLGALFAVTGSVDIMIPRLLSLVAGSASVALIFFLARRYFNLHVAIAASLLAALNPVGLFSDTSGMQEPLGIMLLLLGIASWPKRSFGAGVAWALAGMVRAEYWVLGAGLLGAIVLVEERNDRKLGAAVGWAIPSLLYMKFLLDKTGNPIYPVYWNFMGNAAGAWMLDVPLNSTQTLALWGFRVVTVLSGLAAVWVLWKKPRHHLLFLLGLGNLMFLGLMLGFSAYVRGFLPRFLVDRIFSLPYIFLGLVLAAVALHWLPRQRFGTAWRSVGWILILAVLGISQLAWKPIWGYYEPYVAFWSSERAIASEIASAYDGGVISIMEDRPDFTYFLVHDHGISGRYIEGQKYDPFAYITAEDPFADWSENREMISEWLTSRNIQLLVFKSSKAHYQEMIRREPGWFRYLSTIAQGTIQVYEVTA